MGFHSDKQRKGFFGSKHKGERSDQPVMKEEKKAKPTFRIVKVKGQAFVQRTIKTKKGKIVQRRPI